MARGFSQAPGASPEVEQAGAAELTRAQITVFSQSKNALVREKIAARSDLSLGVLATLAHDRSLDVKVALGSNPAASESVLEHLATDRHVEVLVAVAGNPSTSPALLEKLAFHKKEAVRHAAAEGLNRDRNDISQASHTPELDERDGDAVVISLHAPPPESSRPVRTAPVRGFLPS